MAKGVDGYAHTFCLKNNGFTIAFLANGLDICYPSEHKTLLRKIIEQGAVISEYPPGIKAKSCHFPRRNLLMCAWVYKILIIEAGIRSGCLITANYGKKYQREILAVPNNIYSQTGAGSNKLIYDGAKFFLQEKQLLTKKYINGDINEIADDRQINDRFKKVDKDLEESEREIIKILNDNGSRSLEELSYITGIEPMNLVEKLSLMEVKGLVALQGFRCSLVPVTPHFLAKTTKFSRKISHQSFFKKQRFIKIYFDINATSTINIQKGGGSMNVLFEEAQNYIKVIITWLDNNKEWLFSGSGLLLFSIIGFIWRLRKGKKKGKESVQGFINDNEANRMKVAVGIVRRNFDILMVKRRYRENNICWQFPAGIIKYGQNSIDVIEKEVYDETNIACKVKYELGRRIHPNSNVECIYLYCEYLHGDKRNKDTDENAQVKWINVHEVERHITSDLYYKIKELFSNIKEEFMMKKIVVGIVVKEREVLLVRRRISEGELSWQFPGGEIKDFESESKAVEREFNEEVGIEISAKEKFGERVHPNTDRKIAYWLCEHVSGDAYLKDDDELDRVEWVEFNDIFEYIKSSLYEPVGEYISNMIKSEK